MALRKNLSRLICILFGFEAAFAAIAKNATRQIGLRMDYQANLARPSAATAERMC